MYTNIINNDIIHPHRTLSNKFKWFPIQNVYTFFSFVLYDITIHIYTYIQHSKYTSSSHNGVDFNFTEFNVYVHQYYIIAEKKHNKIYNILNEKLWSWVQMIVYYTYDNCDPCDHWPLTLFVAVRRRIDRIECDYVNYVKNLNSQFNWIGQIIDDVAFVDVIVDIDY